MLGIIIGIAAVIAMVAIGAGRQQDDLGPDRSIGTNLLLVLPGSMTSGGVRGGSGRTQTLTYDDARAIKAECPAVAAVGADVRGGAQVVYGNQNWSTPSRRRRPRCSRCATGRSSAGRNITQSDVDGATKSLPHRRRRSRRISSAPRTRSGKIDPGQEDPLHAWSACSTRKGQSPQGQDQDDVDLSCRSRPRSASSSGASSPTRSAP